MKDKNQMRREYASESDFPCRPDCPKRFVGCHSSCKEYIEAKEKYNAKKSAIRAKKDAEQAVNEYVSKRICEASGKPYKQR